ncbi:MAG: DUF3102 domain-containing protein [Lachnospiraceae bacterium]|nr:DUF3102 domain-containing protein [Lachnospiraceae bacterium]
MIGEKIMNEIETEKLTKIENDILSLKQQTATNIIQIGNYLIEAKKLVPHGEWANWLSHKVDFSQSSANQYMRVAREFSSNSQAIANLDVTKVFMILTLPVDEREKYLNNPDVATMSTRQLQSKIKEEKNNYSNSSVKEKGSDSFDDDNSATDDLNNADSNETQKCGDSVEIAKKEIDSLDEQDLELKLKIKRLESKRDKLKYQREDVLRRLEVLLPVKFRWVDTDKYENPSRWKLEIYVEIGNKIHYFHNGEAGINFNSTPSTLDMFDVMPKYRDSFCKTWKEAYNVYSAAKATYDEEYKKKWDEFYKQFNQGYTYDSNSTNTSSSLNDEDRDILMPVLNELLHKYHEDNVITGNKDVSRVIIKLRQLLKN